MERIFAWRIRLFSFSLLSLLTAHCSLLTAEEDRLLLGAAKRELTPPVKTPLAGYSRRKGALSAGVHDPVFVRALVLRDRDTTVALASCDLLIIDEALYQAVQQRVDAASSAPVHLLIAATHTHSGPGAYGRKFLEKISMGHFNPKVFEFLASQIAQAILDASVQLQPVTVRYGAVQTQGLAVNRVQDGGRVDAQLRVARFEDARRAPMALLVNFSAHPTTLGSWNMALSADYPGALSRALEERSPGALALFVAGAAGDQGPVKHGEQFDAPEWLGQQLAAQAASLEAAPAHEAPDVLGAAQRVEPLPPARIRYEGRSLPSWLSRALVDDDATLTVVTVGRVALIGAPCDLSSELGSELLRHAVAAGYQPIIAGFANDYIGYCLPRALYEADTYEASMAFNGPDTGELLVEQLKHMLDQLAVGSKQKAAGNDMSVGSTQKAVGSQ